MAGLLAVGIPGALVFHQSALALHGLLATPSKVHITIPRSLRRVGPPGVSLHTAVIQALYLEADPKWKSCALLVERSSCSAEGPAVPPPR